ncbi:MAG: tetratricopeptide repeat protein, partial [Bacteroidota bacterium]
VANGMGGNAAPALDYFSRALQLQPEDPDALWNYGVALYTLGQIEEAETQFAKAERIKPGIRAERQR